MNISQKIIDYAIWYYLKYYPSPKKLFLKLDEKFGLNSENPKKYGLISKNEINFIIGFRLKNIIQESEVISSKINYYKNNGKSKNYIRNKLYQRLENPDVFSPILDNKFNNGELDNIKKHLSNLGYSDNLGYNDKQKILRKIFQKGFSYDDINLVL